MMHILVTNDDDDDGPPSLQSSPYIHPFISALESAGHLVSVILPHQQRSWIGKAHFVSQVVRPKCYTPSTDPYSGGDGDGSTVHSSPPVHTPPNPAGDDDQGKRGWILIEGTPATCTQLGLFHLFKDQPPIDLVVSGPNYGRNVTALFSLSSGTLGGAMEAATFRRRAIALSFAFWSRVHDPELIGEACRHSIRIVEHLMGNWGSDVDVYSINVPLVKGVGGEKVFVTPVLQNAWQSGSCFEEVVMGEGEEAAGNREREIREGDGEQKEVGGESEGKQVSFRWKPKFEDVGKSIEQSEEGNDGWAITKGYTSITPLKANFMHASEVPFAELKLVNKVKGLTFWAAVDADDYVSPLVTAALHECLPSGCIAPIKNVSHLPSSTAPFLQILPYEQIDFEHVLSNPKTSLANAYVIRKALTRKHHLWPTVSSWWSKHPDDTALKGHVPLTVTFELDYAEFLEEALVECWELKESFDKDEREWWILKPGMSDQGQGIRMFSSEDELRAIFEEWESEGSIDEDHDGADTPSEVDSTNGTGARTMTSQLRHFVAQRYIEKPLLFENHGNRKFHIRTYVLAVGALKVYVYRDMLALFAPLEYASPIKDAKSMSNPQVHLTNTCLQSRTPAMGSVHRFWDLPDTSTALPKHWKTRAFDQIGAATSTLFEAAAREQMVHFQTLPNAFEVFGVDWLVDESGEIWLLEVNPFPNFRQSGVAFKYLVAGFWKGVVQTAVRPFFSVASRSEESGGDDDMVKVLDIGLGRS